MFKPIISGTALLSFLAACGGGTNVSTENVDRAYAETGQNTWLEIKKYPQSDDTEEVYLLAVKGSIDTENQLTAGKTKYYFAMTDDIQTVENSLNGAIAWTNVDGGDLDLTSGNGYYVSRTGVNQKGDEFTATSQGLNLNLSGSEFVSYGIVEHDGSVTLLTSGTVISSAPSGTFTYNKNAMGLIGVGETLEAINQMTLNANFNEKQGSLTAVSDNLYMSATQFEIDNQNGTFSGNNAEIGERETTYSIKANVLGAFAGSNAGGVHGYVYNSGDDVEDGLGVFVAQR